MTLTAFAPIFEIFVGIGFTFFVITKVEGLLLSLLGVETRADEPIMATINSNIERIKEMVSVASRCNLGDLALEMFEHESELVSIKLKITQKRFRILHNARFYFLSVGFQSLAFLLFCGLEEYCNLPDNLGNNHQFYCSLFLVNVFFVLTNLLLLIFAFQHQKEEPIIWKVISVLGVLLVIVFIGILWKESSFEQYKNAIILFSVISIGLPFLLLLGRHEKFKYYLRNNDFDRQVEVLQIKITKMNRRLPNDSQ